MTDSHPFSDPLWWLLFIAFVVLLIAIRWVTKKPMIDKDDWRKQRLANAKKRRKW